MTNLCASVCSACADKIGLYLVQNLANTTTTTSNSNNSRDSNTYYNNYNCLRIDFVHELQKAGARAGILGMQHFPKAVSGFGENVDIPTVYVEGVAMIFITPVSVAAIMLYCSFAVISTGCSRVVVTLVTSHLCSFPCVFIIYCYYF